MDSDILRLRKHSGKLVEGMGDPEKIFNLAPFLASDHKLVHLVLLTEWLKKWLEPFRTSEHQKSRVLAGLHILNWYKLWFYRLKLI